MTTKQTEMKSQLIGFTPAPDEIAQTIDPLAALVFGRIWRFSQMKDGKCRASTDTIANSIGVSERPVRRKIDALLNHKYIKELPTSPGGTLKLVPIKELKITIAIGFEDHTPDRESAPPDRESYKEDDDNDLALVMQAYSNNIALLVPKTAEMIKDAVDDYPTQWILDAIDLAVEYNARNWRYISAILERWQEKGRDAPREEEPEYVPDTTAVEESKKRWAKWAN